MSEERVFRKFNESADGEQLEHVMTAAMWLLAGALFRFIEAEKMSDEGARAFAKLGCGQVFRQVVAHLENQRESEGATRH